MTQIVHMTYTGSCSFGIVDSDGNPVGSKITYLCSNMSSSLDQKVLFFDHIVGLRDTISMSATLTSNVAGSKKGEADAATHNTQKKVYRYSPAIAKASFSGPIPADNFDKIFDAAIQGDTVETEMVFWKDNAPSVRVGKAKIDNFSIDIKAGGVVTFSVSLTGAEYELTENSTSQAADCQKLLTWDVCSVDASPITSDAESFQMTINNPVIPIYTTKWSSDDASGGMMPQKIRIGMQEVSGSIGVYGADTIHVTTTGDITVTLNNLLKKIKAAFVQPKDNASGGPYVRTIMFTGVNDGDVWQ